MQHQAARKMATRLHRRQLILSARLTSKHSPPFNRSSSPFHKVDLHPLWRPPTQPLLILHSYQHRHVERRRPGRQCGIVVRVRYHYHAEFAQRLNLGDCGGVEEGDEIPDDQAYTVRKSSSPAIDRVKRKPKNTVGSLEDKRPLAYAELLAHSGISYHDSGKHRGEGGILPSARSRTTKRVRLPDLEPIRYGGIAAPSAASSTLDLWAGRIAADPESLSEKYMIWREQEQELESGIEG